MLSDSAFLPLQVQPLSPTGVPKMSSHLPPDSPWLGTQTFNFQLQEKRQRMRLPYLALARLKSLHFGRSWLGIALLITASCLAQESRPSGWVVIPVAEYKALHIKAYPVEPEPEASPVQATLTRIDYDLRIDGELAKGHVDLTVDVLKNGWVSVPIPSGLLVREARLNNKLVSLVASTSGKTA